MQIRPVERVYYLDGEPINPDRISVNYTWAEIEADADCWAVYAGIPGEYNWMADCCTKATAERVAHFYGMGDWLEEVRYIYNLYNEKRQELFDRLYYVAQVLGLAEPNKIGLDENDRICFAEQFVLFWRGKGVTYPGIRWHFPIKYLSMTDEELVLVKDERYNAHILENIHDLDQEAMQLEYRAIQVRRRMEQLRGKLIISSKDGA